MSLPAQELPWVALARQEIGTKEMRGPKHGPHILQYWRDIKRSGIKDDETPWCAAFVGAMLERCGIRSTRYESAKSYETWGSPLSEPRYGCVVVFTREGGGHVGFVVGIQPDNKILVLGGNQADEVNIKAFSTDRVTAYRWPESFPQIAMAMPTGLAQSSTREA